MKILLFYHSLISDWNHGNAHFLRGIYKALQGMGHEVNVFEHKNNWSLFNLLKDAGDMALVDFLENFPNLKTSFYNEDYIDLESYLYKADLILVHEWTDPKLVAWLGEKKATYNYVLLFHDTHHRAVSDLEAMEKYDLSLYDGVLAFGESLRQLYLKNAWHEQVWTWHEAADTSQYTPDFDQQKVGDVVWVGNWGDDERSREIEEFLIEPIRKLNLKAKFYGVRYPQSALQTLEDAGICYGGYLPTSQVSRVFAQYKVTVHVPRRFYTQSLSGIPTIRPFEAMACGIPLLSAPWEDTERLFTPEKDYLVAESGEKMLVLLKEILNNQELSNQLATNGRRTILARHTCVHRAEELISIYKTIKTT